VNTKLQEFINLNQSVISNVFLFACSSGQKIAYIFSMSPELEGADLLDEARELEEAQENGSWLEIYPLTTFSSVEETMRGCTGDFVEV